MLDQRWGQHLVDLFVDWLNTKHPRGASHFGDQLAWGVDEFCQDLTKGNASTHPPPALISRFDRCGQAATAIVIRPVKAVAATNDGNGDRPPFAHLVRAGFASAKVPRREALVKQLQVKTSRMAGFAGNHNS